MPGQPPYCSLFSVCRADDQLRVRWFGSQCVRVYISTHCVRWDKGTAGEKDPPYLFLHPQPAPPNPVQCLTSLPLQIGFYITEAVRYEQLILLSFSFLYFISLSDITA